MRHQHSGSIASSGRSFSWALVPVLALALGALFPGRVQATGGTVPPPPLGSDDESIGTLPILGNQYELVLVRRTHDTRPDFYLEGNYGEILSTIIGFTGSGTVTRENLADGRARLGFHGRIQLALDRGLSQVAGIGIGISVPVAYSGSEAASWFENRASALRNLNEGDLALPVTALDGIGALEQSPWILHAHSRTQGDYHFRALADSGVLFVGQSY